jgi:hypothetical protein
MTDAQTLGPRCPHCGQPTYTPGNPYAHWLPERRATEMGRTLCSRPGTRIGRGDRYGWACPADHTCYAGRLPPLDAND